jgi:Tfp pilus assembly pilus retraction ATPase PilT
VSEASLEGKQSLLEMLKAMVQARASDIHLQAGAPPTIRVDGKLRPFGNRPLTPKDTEAIAKALLTPEQVEELEYRKEMDFAYTIPVVARFRCNQAMMEGSIHGMRTFDQHLVELYKEGLISLEDAFSAATSPHEFKLLLTKATGQAY